MLKILGIETTCDETGIAILEFDKDYFKILADELRSQFNIHKKYGGIVPILAAREHKKNLPILYENIFKKTKIKPKDIDYIAFSIGPGLPPALVEGKEFVIKISKDLNKKIIPVNHLIAHFYSVLIPKNKKGVKQKIKKVDFPSLGLLISGGHTILAYIENFKKIKKLGETLDDAIGESLDKAGRLLGLEYPGGPKIEKLAKEGKPIFNLPRPMSGYGNYNFSFSGLKTALLELVTEIKKYNKFNEETKKDLAASYQKAAFESLLIKTKKAYDRFKVKNIILAGGVSANQTLIKIFKKVFGSKKIIYPEKSLATDNGIKIAFTGYFFIDKAIDYKDLDINPLLNL
ncbi:MAG: tRNA (adenosine(37)-N6)-threonylcarbamoyltransferase complex transferase subunit TsaD [Minisyncoccia bacterium]